MYDNNFKNFELILKKIFFCRKIEKKDFDKFKEIELKLLISFLSQSNNLFNFKKRINNLTKDQVIEELTTAHQITSKKIKRDKIESLLIYFKTFSKEKSNFLLRLKHLESIKFNTLYHREYKTPQNDNINLIKCSDCSSRLNSQKKKKKLQVYIYWFLEYSINNKICFFEFISIFIRYNPNNLDVLSKIMKRKKYKNNYRNKLKSFAEIEFVKNDFLDFLDFENRKCEKYFKDDINIYINNIINKCKKKIDNKNIEDLSNINFDKITKNFSKFPMNLNDLKSIVKDVRCYFNNLIKNIESNGLLNELEPK